MIYSWGKGECEENAGERKKNGKEIKMETAGKRGRGHMESRRYDMRNNLTKRHIIGYRRRNSNTQCMVGNSNRPTINLEVGPCQ